MVGWFTKKNKDGTSTHYQDKKTVRDISDDNDNPITFATPLIQGDEEEILDEFADEKKQEANDDEKFDILEGQQFFEELISELEEIEKDDDLPLDEKMIAYYKLFEQNQPRLSTDQQALVLEKLSYLDSLRKKEEKNQKDKERFSKIKDTLSNKSKDSGSENKTPRSDTEPQQKSKPRRLDYDDDWSERASLLIAAAELE